MKKFIIIATTIGGVIATGSAIIYARSKTSHKGIVSGRDRGCIRSCISKKGSNYLDKKAFECMRKC